MGSVALTQASARSHAELAALFTAGYEGYFMPVAVDEGAFSFMAETWDYDLDASLVGVDGNDDVGLCMLGVRGTSGWIGGVGIVTGRRGEGIGKQLMRAIEDRALSRGIEQLWLEVLVQNEPAIRLYEKLGYRVVRELEVWSLDDLVLQEHDVASAPVADVVGRSPQRPPWQRADAAVKRQDDARALVGGDSSLVYRSGQRRRVDPAGGRRRRRDPGADRVASRRHDRRPLSERAGGRSGQRSARGARRHLRRPPARDAARARLVEADDAADAVLGFHQLEAPVDFVERERVRQERCDVDLAREPAIHELRHLVAALDPAER